MQKFKQTNVQVWFLDDDLTKSAEYLTNTALSKSIDGAVAALVCAIMYFSGIRNKKAYEYWFGKDRRDEAYSKFFPGWPFRNKPAFKFYTSRTSKWTRQCLEHFQHMRAYLRVMLTEYEYRFGKRHSLGAFEDWIDEAPCVAKIPLARISKIALPWKSLKQQFRRKDIIEGYRLQFMDVFCWGDPAKAYVGVDRDIPAFVVEHFHLDTAGMIT